MYKKNFILFLLMMLWSVPAWTQSFNGSILFFPDRQPRPQNDQFEVKAGEQVDVCIRIETQKHPLLEHLLGKTVGFRLVLEDEKVPPNAIIVQEEPKKTYLLPDARGCYASRFQVPPLADEGVYQAADLLFKVPGRGYLSVHQLLYDFSHADEIKVINPAGDKESPALLQIGTMQDQTRRIGRFFDFFKIQVKQDFTFQETGSGLAPESLKVYYRLFENDERTGIYQAKCHKYFKNKNRFNCKLELTRPQYQWDKSRLSLQLESVYLEDKAGNRLVLSDSKVFQKAAGETPIQFNFQQKNLGAPNHLGGDEKEGNGKN
jgi:hypothetical protein